MSRQEYTNETLGITSRLLTWNPEYYTIWNHRRRILRHLLTRENEQPAEVACRNDDEVEKTISDMISNDLVFLIPLLRKYPKCYWIWNYRLWLLEEFTLRLPKSNARGLWEQERAMASKMLGLDSRNFHGWGYRRTVIAALEKPALQPDSKTLTEQEFDYSTKMINTNLSNFSAWHYRSKLIPRLLQERQANDDMRRQFLDEGQCSFSIMLSRLTDKRLELELIQRALWAGDQDQSLWFYHQHLMCTFDPLYADQSMAPNLSPKHRLRYVATEFDKILDMLDGAEDCKYIYQSLFQMSNMYRDLSGEWPTPASQLQEWLSVLTKLDPLRVGRWNDLSGHLRRERSQTSSRENSEIKFEQSIDSVY